MANTFENGIRNDGRIVDNGLEVQKAIDVMQDAYDRMKFFEASGDNEAKWMWFEDLFGMAKMFETLTGTAIGLENGKIILKNKEV